ncbi:hypothetical protein QBC37DRAFT_451543 [Rhypophila decipiens]|uniref:Uncharacterized protein n=1 Tax=Rhypophila decipiens TaxID=261697 RepID=A0AAN6XYE3_9PEZI|nr:hypothetical protein QBC37DRAFT_451543 [Rhypophila decipiens]
MAQLSIEVEPTPKLLPLDARCFSDRHIYWQPYHNKIGSTSAYSFDSALFPEHWTGEKWTTVNAQGSTKFILNPCFWGSDFGSPDDPDDSCTPTSEVSDPSATVWWTFPLARPVLVAPSAVPSATQPTTTTDSTPSSSLSSQSLAPGPSLTFAPPPTPTLTPSRHDTDTSTSRASSTSLRASTAVLSNSTSTRLQPPTSTLAIIVSASSHNTNASTSQPPSSAFTIIIENNSPSPSLKLSSPRLSETRDTATATLVIASSSSAAEALPITANPGPNPSQPIIVGQPIIAIQDSSHLGDASSARSRAPPHTHPQATSSRASHGLAEELDANGVIIPVQTSRSINQVLLSTATENPSTTSATPILISHATAFDNVAATDKETEARPLQTSVGESPKPYLWFPPAGPVSKTAKPYLPFPSAGPVSPDAHSSYYNLQSEGAYLMVSVVPVLLSTLVLVLLQVLTASLNCILPFRALRHGSTQGATLEDSLDLSRNPSILSIPFIAARFLHRFKDPLPQFSTLLTLFPTILVTLSSEVIQLEMTSDCSRDRPWVRPRPVKICAIGLRKSTTLIRVAEGLIAVLALLVITITILLTRWRSGMVADPWSIASMASIMTNR